MPDSSKSKLAPVLRAVAPPLILLVVLLSLWQFSVWWFDLKPFLVPSPVRVATAAYSTFGKSRLLRRCRLRLRYRGLQPAWLLAS